MPPPATVRNVACNPARGGKRASGWRKSASELRSKTGLGSGALYHHLRGLTHAGFAEKRGRGRYTLTAAGMKGTITFLHVAGERSRKPRRERGQR